MVLPSHFPKKGYHQAKYLKMGYHQTIISSLLWRTDLWKPRRNNILQPVVGIFTYNHDDISLYKAAKGSFVLLVFQFVCLFYYSFAIASHNIHFGLSIWLAIAFPRIAWLFCCLFYYSLALCLGIFHYWNFQYVLSTVILRIKQDGKSVGRPRSIEHICKGSTLWDCADPWVAFSKFDSGGCFEFS